MLAYERSGLDCRRQDGRLLEAYCIRSAISTRNCFSNQHKFPVTDPLVLAVELCSRDMG